MKTQTQMKTKPLKTLKNGQKQPSTRWGSQITGCYKFSRGCLCAKHPLSLWSSQTQATSDKSQYGRGVSSRNALFCQDCHYDPFVKGQTSEAGLPVSTLI